MIQVNDTYTDLGAIAANNQGERKRNYDRLLRSSLSYEDWKSAHP